MLILEILILILRIYNEATNALTISAMLCRNVIIFYRKELASLFQLLCACFLSFPKLDC